MENGAGNAAYGLSESDFALWVKKQVDNSKGIGLKEGYVPGTLFVLWIDGVPVGRSTLRHWLTPTLEQSGGHIGCSIGPKFRGRGYANIILAETLKHARKMGIKKVLITVNDDNVPSWKAVEYNGGVLTKTGTKPGDKIKYRYYWICI